MRKTALYVAAPGMILAALVALTTRPGAAGPAGEGNAEAGLRPGDRCVVYLRGDATGVAYPDRIAAVGNLAARRGSLVKIDDSWLVLRHGDKDDWIPRASVALVEVSAVERGGDAGRPEGKEKEIPGGKKDDDGATRNGLDLR
jgi:hypothetical protein